jgi:metal-dependent HD superfamily phosphatase/phosphodiesterase
MPLLTLEDIKNDPVVDAFILKSNQYLGVIGYTEHGYQHVNHIAQMSKNILEKLGYPQREAEMAAIAGYMHDLGNVLNRKEHGISGALMAYPILMRLGMHPAEIAMVIAAIANHEEQYGDAVNSVAAALIVADKSDVHRSRVRNQDFATFDIHDRVNYAVEHSLLWVAEEKRIITMELTIDIDICSVMDYFEIFMCRMIMCRRAASYLQSTFELIINGARLL